MQLTDKQKLGLHPKVIAGFEAGLTECQAQGLCVGLFCGYRAPEESDRLYRLGRTVKNPDGYDPIKKPLGNIVTNAGAYKSWHQYGLAGDIAFLNPKGDWWWPGDKDPRWKTAGLILIKQGFEWGGKWLALDLPHYQMRGTITTVTEAKAVLDKLGITGVWARV